MRPGAPATAPLFRSGRAIERSYGARQHVPAADGRRRRAARPLMARGQILALLDFLGPGTAHGTHWMIPLGVRFGRTNPWPKTRRTFGDGDPEERRRRERARPWRECRA